MGNLPLLALLRQHSYYNPINISDHRVLPGKLRISHEEGGLLICIRRLTYVPGGSMVPLATSGRNWRLARGPDPCVERFQVDVHKTLEGRLIRPIQADKGCFQGSL